MIATYLHLCLECPLKFIRQCLYELSGNREGEGGYTAQHEEVLTRDNF